MGFEIINIKKKQLGLTNAQVSKMSGVTLSTLDKITSGVNRNPKLDTLLALCKVLGCTLDDFSDSPPAEAPASPYSDEALTLAKDFDGLDVHGKRVVRLVADEEKERCESEKNNAAALPVPHSGVKAATETTYYVVPYYRDFPASAGFGEWAADVEPPEELLLRKRPPRGTTFICPVSGVSMTPTFRDGEKVFVRKQSEIRVGQIGIFLMDEKLWIKEMGEGELISHNPEYKPRQMIEGIECQGLVLGVCDESYF